MSHILKRRGFGLCHLRMIISEIYICCWWHPYIMWFLEEGLLLKQYKYLKKDREIERTWQKVKKRQDNRIWEFYEHSFYFYCSCLMPFLLFIIPPFGDHASMWLDSQGMHCCRWVWFVLHCGLSIDSIVSSFWVMLVHWLLCLVTSLYTSVIVIFYATLPLYDCTLGTAWCWSNPFDPSLLWPVWQHTVKTL